VRLGVRVAYHEAGHALAAQFLGRRVESVSIGPDGGGALHQEPLPAEATDAREARPRAAPGVQRGAVAR